jgi:tetratricopeptide (TPR) repeat protein
MANENQSSLEDQRTFLLNSIRELDEEFAVGDLDQDDYQSLRSDYVSRTAEVIKQIESPQTTSTVLQTPRDATQFTRLRKNLLTLLIVIVVAVGSGWLVAQQSGQRLSGQSLTGGIEDSTASLLSRARATNFIDPKAAIDLYSQVLEVDPDNVEALTYRAWLLALIARGAGDEIKKLAFLSASNDLERAITIDANYPDAHCFLGIVRFRLGGDAVGAREQLTICASQNPPAEVKSFVDAIVAEVDSVLSK